MSSRSCCSKSSGHMTTRIVAVLAVPGTWTMAEAPPPRPQDPCDIYAAAGTPCVAAHSTTRALSASFEGSLYQVKRPSDDKTLDIGIMGNRLPGEPGVRERTCASTRFGFASQSRSNAKLWRATKSTAKTLAKHETSDVYCA